MSAASSGSELEQALDACPGPRSGDPWWRQHRHGVMMEFGARLDEDGLPLWPQAAEYLRHQNEFDAMMQSLPDTTKGKEDDR